MKKNILHLKFNTESEQELLALYNDAIDKKEKAITVTPNLDFLRLAYKNEKVKEVMNNADYSTVDGKPILWIAKWIKEKDFKYKVSGSDLSMKVLDLLEKRSGSLFLFGGKDGVAEKAKERINKDYPHINVVGALTPTFGYEKDDTLCKQYIEEINKGNANVVFLCTGCPKTEIFFDTYRDLFNNAVYFSVGATIDFIAGNIKRAPVWMSNVGLEWLYRLFSDFRRLFKRYWLDGWFLIKLWFICHFNKKKVKKLMGEL